MCLDQICTTKERMTNAHIENDAYEIDTVMPREDKCVHFTELNSSVFQETTNNKQFSFMQCINSNICLVTVDACNKQSTKRNEQAKNTQGERTQLLIQEIIFHCFATCFSCFSNSFFLFSLDFF